MATSYESSTATIASGGSLSGAVSFGDVRLFGFEMPSEWTSAVLTFQASFDGGETFVNMKDSYGTERSVTVSASGFFDVDPAPFAAVPLIKIRSGTSATPVSQSGDRSIRLVLRSV